MFRSNIVGYLSIKLISQLLGGGGGGGGIGEPCLPDPPGRRLPREWREGGYLGAAGEWGDGGGQGREGEGAGGRVIDLMEGGLVGVLHMVGA